MVFCALLMGCGDSSLPEPSPGPELDIDYFTFSGQVRRGESLVEIIENSRLDREEARVLLEAVQAQTHYSVSQGQTYEIVFRIANGGNKIESFSLEDGREGNRYVFERPQESDPALGTAFMRYRVERLPGHDDFKDEDIRVAIVEQKGDDHQVRIDTVLVAGKIETDLEAAFSERGESRELIQMLTQVFTWDIDFYKDTQVGDGFSLLIEKRIGRDEAVLGYGKLLMARYDSRGQEYYGILHKGRYFDYEGRSLEKLLMKAPLHFTRVSSNFDRARLHPVLGVVRPHWGVDYAAPMNTHIFAAGDGTVEYAKWVGGYGRTVKIRHNAVYSTYYSHLNGYAPGLYEGMQVSQKDLIGFLGQSGLATGPHLDYRVEKNGQYIDPSTLKDEGGESIALFDMTAFCERRGYLAAKMQQAGRDSGRQYSLRGQGSGAIGQ